MCVVGCFKKRTPNQEGSQIQASVRADGECTSKGSLVVVQASADVRTTNQLIIHHPSPAQGVGNVCGMYESYWSHPSVRPGPQEWVGGCWEASPDIHSCVCVLCLSSCCLFAHCIVLDVCVCVRCFYLYFTFLLKQCCCCCCLSKDRHDAVTRVWPSCRMANDRHDLVSGAGALWVFYARVSCTHYSRVTGSEELVRLCCLCVCV